MKIFRKKKQKISKYLEKRTKRNISFLLPSTALNPISTWSFNLPNAAKIPNSIFSVKVIGWSKWAVSSVSFAVRLCYYEIQRVSGPMCYYVVGYLVVWHNIWHGGMLCGHVGNSEELMTTSHLLLSLLLLINIFWKGSRNTRVFFNTAEM